LSVPVIYWRGQSTWKNKWSNSMTDFRAQGIIIVFGLLVLGLGLPAAFHTITECRAAGGVVVRGLYWWECIR
jgi:hypothetical protein